MKEDVLSSKWVPCILKEYGKFSFASIAGGYVYMYLYIQSRISLHRAKFLANKFRIADLIYPLFEDNPRNFVYHPTAASSPPIIADRPASMFEADTRSSPFIANKRSSLPSILDTSMKSVAHFPLIPLSMANTEFL